MIIASGPGGCAKRLLYYIEDLLGVLEVALNVI